MATTLPIAFLAGFISFLSPCVLPLIPGYISYISGTSFEKLVKKEKNFVLIKKKFPIYVAEEPNIIKIKEKPKVKKIVLITTKFFFLYFILSSDVPEM